MKEDILYKIEKLKKQRAILIEYLNSKVEAEDWHGASDAANDLREVDAEIDCLQWIAQAPTHTNLLGL